MRPKTLLGLAVVVGALLALIYFAQDKVASTDERAAAAKRLVDFEPDEIVVLEIDWQGSRVRFERPPALPPAVPPAVPTPATTKLDGAADPAQAGPWRIVAPFAHRADDAAVARLLAALSGLEVTRDLEDSARAEIGLEPPRGTVTWKTAEGEGRLEIGGAVPASHDVVVAASGRRLPAVTDDSFLADVARPAGDWRSREVVTAGRESIERIAISSPAALRPTVLARSGETLRLEGPIVDLVDRDLADRLLADLAALRMETFLDPPLAPEAERSLAAPAGKLVLTISGEAAPFELEVGSETAGGKRVWRAAGQLFESASTLAAVVARPAAAWRSRNWTRFENWRIEKARVEGTGGAFELVRSEGEWLRDGQKIPFPVASDLLAAITSLQAESLVEGSAEASPSPPRLAITLSDADGNEERLTLLAGPNEAATVPARTAGRDVTLLLPRSLVVELEAKISAARAAAAVADGVPPVGAQPAPAPPAP
ncbi:MAG: DUF4340 domain-containing protein [Thermoanaerobaculia bacterium]